MSVVRRASDVRAVIGVPLYNGWKRGYLEEALDSLLHQTYERVAFVLVDDRSSDKTPDVVATLVGTDPRVHFTRNTRRLGLVGNWRRAFQLGRQLFPEAAYFAWASDHDRWDHRWLNTLVAELDAHPEAVMAYPRFAWIDERGHEITHPWPRLQRSSTPLLRNWPKIGAGNLIYGLYRRDALERAGVFPLVYHPDAYLMVELSLYGELRMVPETLWFRRQGRGDADGGSKPARWARVSGLVGIGQIRRQHRYIFPSRVPVYARLPIPLQHAVLLFWRLGVLGRGRPYVGRRRGSWYAAQLLLRLKQPFAGAPTRGRVPEPRRNPWS